MCMYCRESPVMIPSNVVTIGKKVRILADICVIQAAF